MKNLTKNAPQNDTIDPHSEPDDFEEFLDLVPDDFEEEEYKSGVKLKSIYELTKTQQNYFFDQIVKYAFTCLPLKPKHDVLSFSEAYRKLPTSNAEGKGALFRAYPYQKSVMQAITDPKYDRIIMMFASQTGKSEILNNAIAYFMYIDPSEILMVLPTELAAEDYVKRRIEPMIRDNHYLYRLVNSSDSRNNMMNKYFVGGSVSFIGSGSPTKLASKPIRILIGDEIDRYTDTTEGSSLKLAEKRTFTFNRKRKIILASTPTLKNRSRIEEEFKNSAQHYFFVPCHLCGHKQTLEFEQVVYSCPEDAEYECINCQGRWSDLQRIRNVRKGEWKQVASGKARKSIGYHLNALYSPIARLSHIVHEKILISSEYDRQVFENTVLCRSYEAVGVNYDAESFEQTYEGYTPDAIPDEIEYVICAVDVQQTYLAYEFRGWTSLMESWGLMTGELRGVTDRPYVWDELRALIANNRAFRRKTKEMPAILNLVVIDCGYRPDHVYNFCLSYRSSTAGLSVIPVRGAPKATSMPGYFNTTFINNSLKNRPVINTNTFQCKLEIFNRLLTLSPEGTRLAHFPSPKYGYDIYYYQQLTAETLQQVTTKTGEIKYEFIKARARNEALDLLVYGFVASKYFEIVIRPRLPKYNPRKKK